jgi:hypothetical protein
MAPLREFQVRSISRPGKQGADADSSGRYLPYKLRSATGVRVFAARGSTRDQLADVMHAIRGDRVIGDLRGVAKLLHHFIRQKRAVLRQRGRNQNRE